MGCNLGRDEGTLARQDATAKDGPNIWSWSRPFPKMLVGIDLARLGTRLSILGHLNCQVIGERQEMASRSKA